MCCKLAAILAVVSPLVLVAQEEQPAPKRPTIALRATPVTGFTPLRVRAAAELRDGSDDYADFYCPTVAWDWGDGTFSSNTSDCEPYQSGKSTIERVFRADHMFRQPGTFRISFRLKQKSRQVGAGVATVRVRAGMGEAF